jgi:transposase
MYLSYAVSKGKKYYRIVESYRDKKGTPHQKTLLYLGRLTKEQAQAIKNWIDAFPLNGNDYIICPKDALKIKDAKEAGRIKLIHALWSLLNISNMIKDIHSTCRSKVECADLALALVANRCIDPGSKCYFLRWINRTELPLILDFAPNKLYPNSVYRAMDHLYKIRKQLEENIFERLQSLFDVSTDMFFYDLTSSFFEGRGPLEIAEKGYNAQGRKDCVQVKWGLVTTKEGFPVTHVVYPGNEPDKKTVLEVREDIEKRFAAREAVFIGDKGMIEKEVRIGIAKRDWFYILADTDKNVKAEIFKNFGENPREKLIKTEDGLEVNEFWTVEVDEATGEKFYERIVVCYSAEREEREKRTREKGLKKGDELIREVLDMVKRGSARSHDVVLTRIIRRLERAKLVPYFELEIPESPVYDFTWKRRKKKIEEAARLDGIWALRTNIPRKKMSAEEIASSYKQLKLVEQAFRIIKEINLIRPIRHRLEERVSCHIFLCVLAYLLEKVLEKLLEKMGKREPAPRVIEKFANIFSVEVVAGNFVARRTTDWDPYQKKIFDFIDTSQ